MKKNFFLLFNIIIFQSHNAFSQALNYDVKAEEESFYFGENGSLSLTKDRKSKLSLENIINNLKVSEFTKKTTATDQEALFHLNSISEISISEKLVGENKNIYNQKILKQITQNANKRKLTAWELSLSPYEFIRRGALNYDHAFNALTDEDSKPYFLSKPSEGLLVSSNDKIFIDENYKYLLKSPSSDTTAGKPSSIDTFLLCGTYDILNTKNCSDGLNTILNKMKTYSVNVNFKNLSVAAIVTLPELIHQFLLDSKNHQAIHKAAGKIWKLMNDKELSLKITKSIFDVVYESFLESNLSPTESDRRTWDFMAIYATRGTNISMTIGHYLTNTNLELTAANFAIISHGMGVIDAVRVSNGKSMFSLPASIYSTLDQSKPYHFWLSSYLARSIIAQYNKKTAFHSVWLAQLGYQIKSKTNGRNPIRAFVIDPFDAANNKIRMDITLAAAGISYGISSIEKTSRQINVDDGLKLLLKSGDPSLSPVTQEVAEQKYTGPEGYLRWRQIFSPDTVLNYFTK